jgi:spermidine synthase
MVVKQTIYLMLLCFSLFAEKQFFTEIDPEDPDDPWQQRFEIEKKLFEGATDFQKVLIFQHKDLGRMLVLDGLVQTTEGDEFIYHEMLNHVPLLSHPNPKTVLVIGGGDGGSIREIFRHKNVEKVTMCELDQSIVKLCQEYLPMLSQGAFFDPRLELVFQDGTKFVQETKNRYDLIIIDSTDPVGPGKALFTKEFYADCKKILRDDGILVAQNSIPFYDGDIVADAYRNLSPSFQIVKFYVAPVPSYLGGFMAFSFATDAKENCNRSVEALRARVREIPGKMKYYTPEVHHASFELPQYIIDEIHAH